MKYWRQAALIFAGVSVTWLFQNCSGGYREPASVGSFLSIDHPVVEPTVEAQEGRLILGDKLYLESVFRDAFTSPQSSAGETGAINYYLGLELNPNQHLLGRPCNPYETGDFCGGNIGHAALEMVASSSAAREATRIQVCRWMTSNDVLMNRAISKVSGTDPTPNLESAKGVVRLFYPALDDATILESARNLMTLDQAMNQGGERVLDRWRLLFLSVCETPGWEAL